MIRRAYNKLRSILNTPSPKFDETGERVDITYKDQINFESLDMYQKSHFKRYEFGLENINENDTCGDFACGTGYGSVMLSKKANKVIGADINSEVIKDIKKRYKNIKNVEFIEANLLNLTFESVFDVIISFETIEHFSEENIPILLNIFYKSLKPNGRIIFSTPYVQDRSEAALKLGHHLTFYINEEKIEKWLSDAGFRIELYKYQNYETHEILDFHNAKDFIICVAKK